MNRIFILFFALSSNVFAYVINKGPIFNQEIGYYQNQKQLLTPYYFFNERNARKQKKINKKNADFLSQVKKRNGRFLKIKFPKRNLGDITEQELVNHIFPFIYNRNSPFYLTKKTTFLTEYGLCYGFASALRKFDYLADYRPNQQIETTPSLLEKIDGIFQNKPQIFYGVTSLADLVLSNEEVEFHIRKHLVDQWGVNNARNSVIWTYIEHHFNLRENLGHKHLLKLHEKLSTFLKLGFQPLVFHFWGAKSNIHVYRVIKIDELSDDTKTFKMTLYDFNSELKEKIVTTAIARWYEPVPNEDYEMAEYAQNISNLCQKNSNYCR